jgi:predicted nucleotidyltransferase
MQGLPFVSLEDTITWKSNKNREKDLEDIKLINEYLKNKI